MLSRLGIRQKLSLLLTIPLIAVVLVMVPFTAERISDARSAAATARLATAAREIGGLIQTLQQERLLALGFLSGSTLDRSAYLAKAQESIDDVATLRADPRTAEFMALATKQLEDLVVTRQNVVARTLVASTAYSAYRLADTALLDSLSLGRPAGVDAAGQSQLGALDALMRSNEEASSVGAVLVAAAVDPSLKRLLTDAQTADDQHLRRFRELVAPGQADLVDAVERGQSGQRIRDLATRINLSAVPGATDATEALTAAITYTDLRRLAQDRVAREIAAGAVSRASTASAVAWGVTGGAGALLIIVIFLGVTVSRSISQPLRRLTRAAGVVAEISGAELRRVADSDSPDPAPPKLAAVDVDSSDEIGELAHALNRVQATAALLLERQVSTRRNTSVMFANIARRTQNLVGRQLALIDDLERNERSPELLQRLYRLDHIATRLRRSADSLLVVSGTIDQSLSGTPTSLADIVRTALAEIEGFRAVELGEICEVAVSASVVGDLRLLLAELLENATNFSPPGAPVVITATIEGECVIHIVDHGVGLSAGRMAEENRRLVERERLDVAPTSVLGLFVVGRLARRHDLSVRLLPTSERGVTAEIRLPSRVFAVGPAPVGRSASTIRVRPARTDTIDAIEVPQPYGDFPWFARPDSPIAIEAPAPAGGAAHRREVAAGFAGAGASGATGTAGSVSGRAPVVPMGTPPPVWGEPYDPPPAATRTWSNGAGSSGSGSSGSGSSGSGFSGSGFSGSGSGGSEPTAPVGPPPGAWPPPLPATVAGPGPAEQAAAGTASAAPAGGSRASAPLMTPNGPLPRRDVAPAEAEASDPDQPGRGALSRRSPGTHLSDTVGDQAMDAPTIRVTRDPEAERAALDEYLSGLARGDSGADQPSPSNFAERPR